MCWALNKCCESGAPSNGNAHIGMHFYIANSRHDGVAITVIQSPCLRARSNYNTTRCRPYVMVHVRVNSTTSIGMHVNRFLELYMITVHSTKGGKIGFRPRRVLLAASRPSTNNAHGMCWTRTRRKRKKFIGITSPQGDNVKKSAGGICSYALWYVSQTRSFCMMSGLDTPLLLS